VALSRGGSGRGLAKRAYLFRVYAHLLAAGFAFVAIETALFRTGLAKRWSSWLAPYPWLLVLGAFMLVAWALRRVVYRKRSLALQYLALALFVVAEAFLFAPLLFHAETAVPGAIATAAPVALAGFLGLTLVALLSGVDFSFLGALLRWGFFLALILIIAASFGLLHLGVMFNVAMLGLAGGAVLHDTSRLLRRRSRRHVAAALELFSSMALLFWYVVRMTRRLAPR